jgi:RNA recognition motif-containing protein
MNWEDQLISTYLNICEFFKQHPDKVNLRGKHCTKPKCTDEEILTFYLYGIAEFHSNKKEMYKHIKDFLLPWFPHLPNYEAFNYRVNQLDYICYEYCCYIMSILQFKNGFCYTENLVLVDSLPIMMATGFRATQAKVAKCEADLGYCASKNIYYYGVKIHMLAKYNEKTLPTPYKTKLTKASVHDLTAARRIFHEMKDVKIIGDKAYADKELKNKLKEKNVEIHTPIKLSKTKKVLDEDEKKYSQIISSFRQPIESLFNWFIEKTNIQKASKVRSRAGLLTHVFGRLAGGLLLLHFSF